MQSLLPEAAAWEAFQAALLAPPPTSLRLQPLKNGENLPAIGGSEDWEQVAWAEWGRYLPSRPSFTRDPLFHAGAYYVQEASSMFLERIWREAIEEAQKTSAAPLAVLDLCAAPGGKSSHALSLLPENSLLVCNEINDNRAQILAENLQKWGSGNPLVCQNTPQQLSEALPNFFDIILVDAPCSGEGMFRKDPNSILEWSPKAVEHCVQRQRDILRSAWAMLRAGGLLIYSTCTYNRAENEENLLWFCAQTGAKPMSLTQDAAALPYLGLQVEEAENGLTGYRFYPHKIRGEGFFASFLRKETGEAERDNPPKSRQKSPLAWLGKKQSSLCGHLLQDAPRWLWLEHRGMYRAFDKTWGDWYAHFYERLRVVYAGISVADVLPREELRPQHALALHTAAEGAAFESLELDLQQAQSFLRLADFELAENAPRGWLRAVYQGRALGWLKNLGNRHNNYYPKNWRIRMDL